VTTYGQEDPMQVSADESAYEREACCHHGRHVCVANKANLSFLNAYSLPNSIRSSDRHFVHGRTGVSRFCNSVY